MLHLHPPIVHFAIVLPIIALILGIAYLIKPSELMSKISTRFMFFATLFIVAAFFTGKAAGAEAFILLPTEGQELLKSHKNLGLYLMVGMAVATIFKFVGCFKRLMKSEVLAILILAILSVGVLYQGKTGGELTFTYGANVANHSDGMDCLADPNDFIDEEK